MSGHPALVGRPAQKCVPNTCVDGVGVKRPPEFAKQRLIAAAGPPLSVESAQCVFRLIPPQQPQQRFGVDRIVV